MKTKIKNEYAYPIYFISANWNQNNMDYTNHAGTKIMYKKDPGISSVRQQAIEWIEKLFKKDKYKDKNCELISLNCSYVEDETWILRWFNHITYNIHLTNEELLISFDNFVDRNRDIKKDYVLMGAEDRCRWSEPCRCEKCIKNEIVTIDH